MHIAHSTSARHRRLHNTVHTNTQTACDISRSECVCVCVCVQKREGEVGGGESVCVQRGGGGWRTAVQASSHESPWTAVVPSTWVTHLTKSPFQHAIVFRRALLLSPFGTDKVLERRMLPLNIKSSFSLSLYPLPTSAEAVHLSVYFSLCQSVLLSLSFSHLCLFEIWTRPI